MRYLIFDIECCDGKHICEFGYVITDEKFNLLKKEVLKINPDKPFNLIGRKDQDDLILSFTEQEYRDSPLFTEYYDKIKDLIEYPDQIIIGHAIDNDARFLRTACLRYKLPSLNFEFVDSQKIYGEFVNDKRRISLEKAEEILNLAKPEFLHKSDDDAFLTMQLIQKMCSTLEMTVKELMTLCPTACGRSHNFNIMYSGDSLHEMLEALDKNENSLSMGKKKRCVIKFAEEVSPQGEIIKSRLFGTKLCFSTKYEKEHVKETLKLIQLLANHGCRYNAKVSENDFYVVSQEDIENPESDEHTRYYAATHREDGHQVEVLTMEELLKLLGVSEDELISMEMPKVPKRNKDNKRRGNYYSTGKVTTTLGDLLRSHGVDLKKAK